MWVAMYFPLETVGISSQQKVSLGVGIDFIRLPPESMDSMDQGFPIQPRLPKVSNVSNGCPTGPGSDRVFSIRFVSSNAFFAARWLPDDAVPDEVGSARKEVPG